MRTVTIHHQTTYKYRQAVTLAAHRLMLRPRESREVKLVSHQISMSPKADISWATDVFGNAVATTTFASPTASLTVNSVATVNLSAAEWPVFDIAASAINFPFRYSDRDWADLGNLAAVQYLDDKKRLGQWAQGFVASESTDTLSLLKDISLGVASSITYQSREEQGTQTPTATLDRGFGSCRDFAVLFAEAVRSLGFGARIVSGYLYDPKQALIGSADAGSTHAWAEVFVPGAGWITFDPTNRSMGGSNLIPVAVTRDIVESVPVAGSFVGPTDSFVSMDVEVKVNQI